MPLLWKSSTQKQQERTLIIILTFEVLNVETLTFSIKNERTEALEKLYSYIIQVLPLGVLRLKSGELCDVNSKEFGFTIAVLDSMRFRY